MTIKAYLAQGVSLFFVILFWITFARCLLSWFPDINWYNQPFRAVKDITDPILEPFRKIIPPLGGFDISPMVALLALEMLRYILVYLIVQI